MAEQKDLFERLADLGEEAIARLAEMPGMGPAAKFLTALRDRVEDLQHAVAGVQGLERRVERLERELAELKGQPAGPHHLDAPRPEVHAPPPVDAPGETEAASGGFVTPPPPPPGPPGP